MFGHDAAAKECCLVRTGEKLAEFLVDRLDRLGLTELTEVATGTDDHLVNKPLFDSAFIVHQPVGEEPLADAADQYGVGEFTQRPVVPQVNAADGSRLNLIDPLEDRIFPHCFR